MGMPQTDTVVRALPDGGNRYEVVDGELLVTPAPRLSHQSSCGLLFVQLFEYVRANAIGMALFSPADIEFYGTISARFLRTPHVIPSEARDLPLSPNKKVPR
jgi:Uma2 family endonuclease